MGQDLPDAAGMLRGVIRQLNAAATEASAVVQAVDQLLGEELAIGVAAASRAFDSQLINNAPNEAEMAVTSHLAYGRVQGKDRIHVLKATLRKDEWKDEYNRVVAEERIPWSACSRDVKLQSFARLPELLTSLTARVDEVASETSQTVATVRALLDAYREAPAHQPPPVTATATGTATSEDPDDVPPDPIDVTREVPLHELTASAAPSLFKRPRASRTGTTPV
jgi:hypothetical protein